MIEEEPSQLPRPSLPALDAGSARARDAGVSDAPDAEGRTVSSDASTDGATDGESGGALAPAGFGKAPRIPARPATCPEIKTGSVTVNGQRVQLWLGAKKPGKQGPILFYWHGTGSTPPKRCGS